MKLDPNRVRSVRVPIAICATLPRREGHIERLCFAMTLTLCVSNLLLIWRTWVMGVLIAKKYPTNLFAKLADHTYVECGTGRKAWSCWGGKTGGTEFRRDLGSTLQADQIAEPNERGGITCYLINGVCHQAANRILLPAN